MRLVGEAATVLAALQQGATLKAHRTMHGLKQHRLHPLTGMPVAVSVRVVRQLESAGLIRSNLKFPTAIYLLTIQGSRFVVAQADQASPTIIMKYFIIIDKISTFVLYLAQRIKATVGEPLAGLGLAKETSRRPSDG